MRHHERQLRNQRTAFALLERQHRQERREYRAAENRIKESILLRDVLPGHTYPRHEQDHETIHAYHSKYGIPELGLWARARRLLGGEALRRQAVSRYIRGRLERLQGRVARPERLDNSEARARMVERMVEHLEGIAEARRSGTWTAEDAAEFKQVVRAEAARRRGEG